MFFDANTHIIFDVEPFCMCSQDAQMSVCMAYESYTQGCRFLLATPSSDAFLTEHNGQSWVGISRHIQDRYQTLCEMFKKYFPEMKVGLGSEIYCTRNSIYQTLKHLESRRLPTLNGSPYVLIDFPEHISLEDIWFCLDRLDRSGYRPVVSNVDSIDVLKWNIHEIRALRGETPRDHQAYRFRCVFMLSTASLHHSSPQRNWARELIRCGVVDVLGTSARNTSSYPVHIRQEISDIQDICTPEYLHAISWENACRLFCHHSNENW